MNNPLLPLIIAPGIVKDYTDYASEGRWVDGNLVRFRGPYPEKIGGWESETDYTLLGKSRSVLLWRMLDQTDNIAIGTHSHLYLIQAGIQYDITPLRATTDPMANNSFATVNTSATVTVTDVAHGAVAGDYVFFSGVSVFNNVTIAGEYLVQTAATADIFTITAGTTANATGAGGGAAAIVNYLISTGNENATGGVGWGAGTYSRGGYGSAVTGDVDMTVWSLDNWGEDLVATPTGGGVYTWDASVGVGTRAALLTNAPDSAQFVRTNPDIRHMSAYGAHTGSVADPMNVRWCDQDDNTVWASTATNTAGSFRLSHGGQIISTIDSRGGTFIFTDTSLYLQAYSRPPFIFNFQLLAHDISILGQNSIIEKDGIVYWMGEDCFCLYNGRVVQIKSPVRRYVFDNINKTHAAKSFIGINEKFQEIWYFYPDGANEEPNRYVAFNYGNTSPDVWLIGALTRTCWADSQLFIDTPLAIGSDGTFYYHETGVDNDASAINPYIESGVIQLKEQEGGVGGSLMLMDRFIPDATVTGNMKLTLSLAKFPQDTETTKGPYTITPTTSKVSLRARARQLRIKLESDAVGDKWTLGQPRYRLTKSGGR